VNELHLYNLFNSCGILDRNNICNRKYIIMWLSLIKFGISTAGTIYKNRKETKVLESIAEKKQMQRVIDGEIEMVKTIKQHQANDTKRRNRINL